MKAIKKMISRFLSGKDNRAQAVISFAILTFPAASLILKSSDLKQLI